MAADVPLAKTTQTDKFTIVGVGNSILCMGVMGKEWLFLNMNLMYYAEPFL